MTVNILERKRAALVFLILIFMSLLGCGTASLNIKHIENKDVKNRDTISHRSVYYALPKTQLVLTQHFKTTTKYYLKNDTTKTPISIFCSSQLPTTKVGIDISTQNEPSKIELATRVIPDAQHIYAVELNAGYFENFDLTLDLSESGIIQSVDAKIVDQADQIAIGTATALISALVSTQAPQARITSQFKDGQKSIVKPFKPSDHCSAFDKQARDYLKKLAAARQALFLQPKPETYENANVEELAIQYDNEIKKAAVSLAKSSVSVNPVEKIIALPEFIDSVDENCSQIKIGSSNAYKVCASVSNDLLSYKSLINDSELGYKKSNYNNGLRYRTPLVSKISIKKDDDVKVEKELAIAQYGPITTLPASLGNRTASYKLDLYDLTSSLQKLTISSAGSSPDKVAEALSGAIDDLVKSSGQRDKEKLEKEIEILELLKKKKDAENSLAD